MYVSEFKNSLFSIYDIDSSFVKLSMQSTAKPNSIYNNEYTSRKYNTTAKKVALNLNHYVSVENTSNRSSLLFSQRELKKFLTFTREKFAEWKTEPNAPATYTFTPDLPEYYPNIILVISREEVQIWTMKTETLLVSRLIVTDFFILMSMLSEVEKNFLVLSSNNTILYAMSSAGASYTDSGEPAPDEKRNSPFTETVTEKDVQVDEEGEEEEVISSLDLTVSEGDPNDIPDFLR